jgi:GxxExxY protein
MALDRELLEVSLRVSRQFAVRIYYDGEELMQYRLDMVINETLVVEVKSTYVLHPGAKRQTYNYLRATNLEVALLLHFGPEPKFYRFIHSNKKA